MNIILYQIHKTEVKGFHTGYPAGRYAPEALCLESTIKTVGYGYFVKLFQKVWLQAGPPEAFISIEIQT